MEDVEQRRQYAINKQKKLEAKQAAQKAKRRKAELAKASKKLMRLGPDLVGLCYELEATSKKIALKTKCGEKKFAKASKKLMCLGFDLIRLVSRSLVLELTQAKPVQKFSKTATGIKSKEKTPVTKWHVRFLSTVLDLAEKKN